MARLSSLLFPFLFFLHLAPVLLLAQTAVCDEAVPSSGNSGSSSNDNAENEGPVITELTDATFDDFLKDNDYCVVLFYVPWSSYCQDFLPVFEEVAKSVRGSTAAAVGMIQVMKNKGVAASQEIESFPTLRIYM